MNTSQSEPASLNPAIADPVAALERPFVLSETEEQQATVAPQVVQDSVLTRMNFKVGDLELLCKQDDSREVVEPPVVERVPNTASWFKGIANIRGNMTPIVDLGEALGNRSPEQRYPYLMLFGRGVDSFGVLIDALPRNELVSPGRRLATSPPLPAMLQESVLGAYSHNDQIYIDLNIDDLSKSLSNSLQGM